MITWDEWVNDEGVVICLGKVCPRTVDKLVDNATEKTLHRQIANASERPQFEYGIYLDPSLE